MNTAPAPQPPRPLADWPRRARAALVGVMTDIDDTLTTEGAITPDALAALQALRAAGLHRIAVTGRPVGWSLPFAAAWPLDALVAENGAVALIGLPQDGGGTVVRRLYRDDADIRADRHRRLQQVLRRIEAEIPGAIRATDSAGRETDIAIDHSEYTSLDDARIAQVVQAMQAEGLHATVSSIHINGWFGDHDKLVGAEWVVQALLGRPLAAERDRWAYVGDSTNDQRMFGAFDHSIGVANVRRFLPRLTQPPRYIATAERGAGFAEVVDAILAARQP
ncbi:HAD-IIB family hydrolase [Xylophilus sp. Kf1]|nr:HAD-IIB family hydrolase [Xylophilus sp. Kf1]